MGQSAEPKRDLKGSLFFGPNYPALVTLDKQWIKKLSRYMLVYFTLVFLQAAAAENSRA